MLTGVFMLLRVFELGVVSNCEVIHRIGLISNKFFSNHFRCRIEFDLKNILQSLLIKFDTVYYGKKNYPLMSYFK